MLVGTHHAAIDKHLDLGGSIQRVGPPGNLGMLKDPIERPIGRPPPKPVETGLPRPIALRNLAPRRSGVHMPQDPVEHRAMISPPTTAPRFSRRQQRLDMRPRLISQFIPSDHLPTTDNDPSPTPPKVRTSSPIRQTRPSSVVASSKYPACCVAGRHDAEPRHRRHEYPLRASHKRRPGVPCRHASTPNCQRLRSGRPRVWHTLNAVVFGLGAPSTDLRIVMSAAAFAGLAEVRRQAVLLDTRACGCGLRRWSNEMGPTCRAIARKLFEAGTDGYQSAGSPRFGTSSSAMRSRSQSTTASLKPSGKWRRNPLYLMQRS